MEPVYALHDALKGDFTKRINVDFSRRIYYDNEHFCPVTLIVDKFTDEKLAVLPAKSLQTRVASRFTVIEPNNLFIEYTHENETLLSFQKSFNIERERGTLNSLIKSLNRSYITDNVDFLKQFERWIRSLTAYPTIHRIFLVMNDAFEKLLLDTPQTEWLKQTCENCGNSDWLYFNTGDKQCKYCKTEYYNSGYAEVKPIQPQKNDAYGIKGIKTFNFADVDIDYLKHYKLDADYEKPIAIGLQFPFLLYKPKPRAYLEVGGQNCTFRVTEGIDINEFHLHGVLTK
jgi:hypothetical protein